jgi:hypothetical protein
MYKKCERLGIRLFISAPRLNNEKYPQALGSAEMAGAPFERRQGSPEFGLKAIQNIPESLCAGCHPVSP